MKRLIRVFLMTLVLSSLLAVPAAAAGPPQSSDVILTSDGVTVVGNATLKRQNGKVNLNVKTTGLEAGAAYTVWFVVFNDPAACVGGCDGDDLFTVPAAKGAICYAAGHVVGNKGKGNFAANLREGGANCDLTDFADVTGLTPLGQASGLIDASSAEIHIVTRTHGAPIPGQVDEQISSFGGGCSVNACNDDQFAVFP
jgi:hypothetical protein